LSAIISCFDDVCIARNKYLRMKEGQSASVGTTADAVTATTPASDLPPQQLSHPHQKTGFHSLSAGSARWELKSIAAAVA
jgi:hypothetical protein